MQDIVPTPTKSRTGMVLTVTVTCAAVLLGALAAYLARLHAESSELMQEARSSDTLTQGLAQAQARKQGGPAGKQGRVYELAYDRRASQDPTVWIFQDSSANAIAAMRQAGVQLLLVDGVFYSVTCLTPTSLRMLPLSTASGSNTSTNTLADAGSTVNRAGVILHVLGW